VASSFIADSTTDAIELAEIADFGSSSTGLYVTIGGLSTVKCFVKWDLEPFICATELDFLIAGAAKNFYYFGNYSLANPSGYHYSFPFGLALYPAVFLWCPRYSQRNSRLSCARCLGELGICQSKPV